MFDQQNLSRKTCQAKFAESAQGFIVAPFQDITVPMQEFFMIEL
jgi:hypothetical protein